MNKFKVLLCRQVISTITYEFEAQDEIEAREIAEQKLNSDIDWDILARDVHQEFWRQDLEILT